MFAIAGASLALFLWLRDLAKNTNSKTLKPLLNILIVISITGVGVFGVWAAILSGKKNYTKDTTNIATVPVHDTVKLNFTVERPVLELFGSATNPAFNIIGDTTWTFTIDLRTNGKEVAANIFDKNTLIYQKDSALDIYGSTNETAVNEKTTIGETGSRFSYGGKILYPFSDSRIPDTMYDYVKVRYSNRDGAPQPPFIGLYTITKDFINKSLPDVGGVKYREIKKYLIAKGFW